MSAAHVPGLERVQPGHPRLDRLERRRLSEGLPELAAPALDVDDEHSAGADDQDVDVRGPGARPAPVGQDVPAHVVHADQHPDHPVLGPAAGSPRAFLATQLRQQMRQATDVPLDDLDLQADQRCLGEGGRRGLVRCGGVVLTGHSRPLTCAATD
jgi:hypothetical protein